MSIPANRKKKFAAKPVLLVFWSHLAKYKLATAVTVILTMVVISVDVIAPLYYKRFFDELGAAAAPSLGVAQILITILFSVLGLHFLGWILWRITNSTNFYLQAHVMNDLVQTAFAKTLDQSYGFFVNNFSGSLTRKINRLPRAFEVFGDRLIFELLPLAVTLIGILAVLFYRHPFLGWAFLIWVVFLLILQYFIARAKASYHLKVAEKDSETGAVLADAITNDVTIKLFTGTEHERSLFRRVVDELRDLRLKSWRFDEVVNAGQGILMIGIEFLLMYLGVRLWQRGVITIGDFALIQSYLVTAVMRLWNVGNVLRRVYEAFADASEMVEIINRPLEVVDQAAARPLQVKSGEIKFSRVFFNFHQTREVLGGFDLRVASQEKVALIGPSGAGKTTVTKLLLRLYDVSSGGIFIDGQNIAEVTQESLRQAVALVPQEPILFHRTLMENIRYGRREASDEEVIEAARQANCYDFIERLPDGFNTYVGERGIKLSGGERQRVAIARAILKGAPILILDEATSSLDSESEALIQSALARLMAGKTVIVIAHRLSTIMKMDRIIVMENGKIVTTGTHQALLATAGGLYKKLWEIQAGGFLPE